MFVRQRNPIASALMAKMKMADVDRPKVRLECLRLLATLKLDPAKSKLIGGFIDTYLRLNVDETKLYEREFARLTAEEKGATMELMTSWHRQGRQEGKEELVVLQIRRRLANVSAPTIERLDLLTSEQLNELGEALLDFETSADLESWLDDRCAPN